MTVLQIIDIAKISQFLAQVDVARGALFGQRVTPLTPKILYTERRAVEWLYNLTPEISQAGASGSILMTFIGYTGDKISISVNGTSLGTYTRVLGDTTLNILVASIAAFFNGVDGFVFSAVSAIVNINAPSSLGSTVNGTLSVTFTPTTTYPYLIFDSISMITSTTALAHGTAVVQGGVLFFDNAGYCISTSPNPDLSSTVFSSGAGSGQVGLTLTGLASGTLYYIRMYGTYNTTTTIYSEQYTFTTL